MQSHEAVLCAVRDDLPYDANINSTLLSAVLGIGLYIKGDLLSLVQSLETFDLNGREMNEYVVATLIVGDEAITLVRIEPLNGTRIHEKYLLAKIEPAVLKNSYA